ncbi:MAG TPA: M28 family peptidase [Gemmatimonadales bacterium]|nr:M28 family peptidase [Gemmatimonadales bacterium]
MIRTLTFVSLCLAPAALAAQGRQMPERPVTIVPQPATTFPLKHAPARTRPAITAADLMTRLYIYADDSMQGREAGTAGNVRATDYIEREVRRMGLLPAGDNGTYFQTLPYKTRQTDSASTFTLNGSSATYGQGWVAQSANSLTLTNAAVVFAGSLTDTAAGLTAADVRGKVVVLPYPTARAQQRAFMGRQAGLDSAAAVIIIGADEFMGRFTRPVSFVDDTSAAAGPRRGQNNRTAIILDSTLAQQLFYQPIASLKAGAAGRPISLDLRVATVPVPFPARNVVAILPGSDPKLKNEYVAIGGHNDHIGMRPTAVDHDSLRIFNHIVRPGGAEQGGKQATPEEQAQVNTLLAAWRAAHPGTARQDSISNGADDDGSGTVSVLEIAEKMAALRHKPKRSTIFVWHVGEEKGLLGSQYFTDHPTVPRDSIVAQLNIDMVGRGDAWDVTGTTIDGTPIHGNPNYLQLVGSRRLSTELGDLAEAVDRDGKHGLVFDYSMDANGHPTNIYCRSDHYSYARYGIPIIFFTTGGHSDYHQVTDEPEYIDYDHMARVGNFIEDLAEHVGNLDHRPVVDHDKPDPHGRCQQ